MNLNQGFAYVSFGIVLFVWEFLPTFIVVMFFRVQRPRREELVSWPDVPASEPSSMYDRKLRSIKTENLEICCGASWVGHSSKAFWCYLLTPQKFRWNVCNVTWIILFFLGSHNWRQWAAGVMHGNTSLTIRADTTVTMIWQRRAVGVHPIATSEWSFFLPRKFPSFSIWTNSNARSVVEAHSLRQVLHSLMCAVRWPQNNELPSVFQHFR